MKAWKWMVAALGVLALASCGSQTPAQHTDAQFEQNVINGTASATGARPYQVALLRSSTGSLFCGGTLISSTWVMTAAHCSVNQTPSGVRVRAGSLSPTSGGQLVNVSQIVVHPSYNANTLQNDIALWRLSAPVNTPYATPASLPTAAVESAVATPGKLLTISGWGRYTTSNYNTSSHLREANLPVLTQQQCQTLIGNPNGLTVTSSMICGNLNTQAQTGCHGDSGGPFATRTNNRFYVFGVVSWGKSTCSSATAFTRVTSFTGWISQVTGLVPSSVALQDDATDLN